MSRISYLVVAGLFLFTTIEAQVTGHWCGTSFDAQQSNLEAYLSKSDEIFNANVIRSGAVTYLPVKFHLMSATGRVGEIEVEYVFRQLCRLNTDYESVDIQFYLKDGIQGGILRRSDDRVWMDPSTAVSRIVLRGMVNANRDAVNIIVNNSAESGNGQPGITLGYWTPTDDYLVVRKSEVQQATSTLTHELGHFLGLVHTAYGWELTEYNCNNPTPINIQYRGALVPVEYVSRSKFTNGQLNCRIAADGLCDTQADYNLGFGYSGPCSPYVGCAKDPDGVDLTPSTENFMSYFTDCLSTYTTEQQSVMLANIASAARNYIRSTYVPDLTELNERTVLISPENNETTPYYDEVDLEWEATTGAQAYIVEVDRTPNFSTGLFQELVVGATSATVTDLLPGKVYYWRVTPVAEYHNCPPTARANKFTTSSVMTASDDITGVENWTIFPNPAFADDRIGMAMEISEDMLLEIDIHNVAGVQVFSSSMTAQQGRTVRDLNVSLKSGLYFVRIEHKGQFAVRKLIVK